MLRLIPLLVFLHFTFILTGCESSGTIRGLSDGRPVHMKYKQGFSENDGVLKVTLPDGEAFSGKFVQKSTSKSGDELGLKKSSDDDVVIINSITRSSHAEAILIGNKGHTMKCEFQLSDPEDGIDGGGIGNCKTSAGKTISMTF